MSNKTILRLSNITTYRSKPGRGPLVDKLPNMRPKFNMQRGVVPDLVAECGDGPTRTTNRSGRPTR